MDILSSKKSFRLTFIYIINSVFLLGVPIIFDLLYNQILDYSRLTYTIFGRLFFLYSFVTLVGVILSLHMISFLICSVKKWISFLLGVFLAAETFFLHNSYFYGSLLSYFFLVIVLTELFCKSFFLKGN